MYTERGLSGGREREVDGVEEEGQREGGDRERENETRFSLLSGAEKTLETGWPALCSARH